RQVPVQPSVQTALVWECPELRLHSTEQRTLQSTPRLRVPSLGGTIPRAHTSTQPQKRQKLLGLEALSCLNFQSRRVRARRIRLALHGRGVASGTAYLDRTPIHRDPLPLTSQAR